MNLGIPCPTRPELLEAVRLSVEKFKALPQAEQDAMMEAQKKSWVRAEMEWPRDCPYR